MSKLLLPAALLLGTSLAAFSADQQSVDYQKQYEEYQQQLKIYNQQMEEYKKQLREHQNAPMDNDATYVLPGQYTAGRRVTQQPQKYTPQQQYYQQYDYYDQRQKPGDSQPSGHLPNYYY